MSESEIIESECLDCDKQYEEMINFKNHHPLGRIIGMPWQCEKHYTPPFKFTFN